MVDYKTGDLLRLTFFRGRSFEDDPLWAVVRGHDRVDIILGPPFTISTSTYKPPSTGWSLTHGGFDDGGGPRYEVVDRDDAPDDFYVAQAKWALLS